MPTDNAAPIVAYEKVSARRQLLADAALPGLTLVWGTSFALVKDILEQVGPMLFLTVRFALAALALVPIIFILKRWRGMTMRELRWGVLVGVVLWIGYALQAMGLHGEHRTSASNAGFITGLSVVMVPIAGVYLLRQRPHRWALAGVALATIGLGLLSLRFEEGQGLTLT
jgi:drug/metabolite transporter (DMT)-like permease